METEIRTLLGDTDPETLTAPEVLGVMVEHFHPRLSLACSFQKEEAVLLDMLLAKKRASDRREWLERKGNLASTVSGEPEVTP